MRPATLLLLLAADPQALRDPAFWNEHAPAVYRVRTETTAGAFTLEARPDWAPRGADRFYNLVRAGFYDAMRRLSRGTVAPAPTVPRLRRAERGRGAQSVQSAGESDRRKPSVTGPPGLVEVSAES